MLPAADLFKTLPVAVLLAESNIRLRLPMAHQTSVESKVTVASKVTRRLPIGAEVQPAANGGGVHFRVWAPDRKRVAVVIDGHAHSAEDVKTERLLQRPDRRRG